MSPSFHVKTKDSRTYARTGVLDLKHGKVETPVFMPVGTYGAVRGVSSLELSGLGSEIMLANTYHMFSRAGVELIEKMKGLHSFISWDRPILTDSGGFQVFSLADLRKMNEEGVTFKNKLSGDTYFLSPEIVVDIQEKFGSDIMMVLDECSQPNSTHAQLLAAVERTTRWAQRSRVARTRKDLAQFPIIQGGTFAELRHLSLQQILKLEENSDPWEGIAIGGLSVGESKDRFIETLYDLRGRLPSDRPRYLMGVGTPRDLVFAVACGVDMFDCVLPSRNGRHGIVMTTAGRMNLFNAVYQDDSRPLDETCECFVCKTYSRAFLRHLFKIEDTLAGRLCTIHNVAYFLNLMKRIRSAIENGTYANFVSTFLSDPKHVFLGGESKLEVYPNEFLS